MSRCSRSKFTASAKWLRMAAISLDMQADDSLTAWVFLGQTHRYAENKIKAAALRHAAGIKNLGERREYLRNNGVEALQTNHGELPDTGHIGIGEIVSDPYTGQTSDGTGRQTLQAGSTTIFLAGPAIPGCCATARILNHDPLHP